jgi:hypothetical protein
MRAGRAAQGYAFYDLVVYPMQKINTESEICGAHPFNGFPRNHFFRPKLHYDLAQKDNIESARIPAHLGVPFDIQDILYLDQPHKAGHLAGGLGLHTTAHRQGKFELRTQSHHILLHLKI